ncbi:MAG: YHS domain-containing protein [Proteobacteria bacterium]|nr:YHS domain-containing protein [Pseudomonadota bacterium]MBU4294419.1 YHS domain-containing protein [Pseudomonadota bacterium]MCG2747601.1 YHS domain-containing protein [Desulfobulbaceae bacterium]
MKPSKTFILTFFFLTAFGATAALAAPQTTCPVMGGAINKEIHVDYEGKRIYFCCDYCIGEFKKDPEKYLQKMKEIGQEPAPIAPITDEKK